MPGSKAAFKRLYRIDLRYAHDVSNVSGITGGVPNVAQYNPNQFFVFAFDDHDLPFYEPQEFRRPDDEHGRGYGHDRDHDDDHNHDR